MAYLLHLDTATEICSVSLFNNSEHIATKLSEEKNSHSKLIPIFIQQLTKEHKINFSALSAVSISAGPGSYTGLRIGASIAKGMCYTLGIPMIALPTLQTMAASALAQNSGLTGVLCPMIDARRNEIYTALYDDKLNCLKPVEPLIVDTLDDFKNWSENIPLTFFGSGAEKNTSIIIDDNINNITKFRHSSEYCGTLVFNMFMHKNFVDIAYFEPDYLKVLGERIKR